MKLGMAICLCVGIISFPLGAQQTLLASGGTTPGAFFLAAPPIVTYALPRPGFSADASAVAVGLAPDATLYDLALGPTPDGVCTQLLAAVSTPSDYAFDRAQFSAAALKASFSHDNMVKMAHNFVPGQPLPDAPNYHPLTPKQKF